MMLPALLLLIAAAEAEQLGPGAGPWETATPESQGLSTELLDLVEQRVDEAMSDRLCYIVVKNGKIVHETYRRGHTESSLHAGWSTTKSLCASLYGVAVQQGWADVDDRVADRNSGTRQCNPDATFRHVLAMTGQSNNIDNPQFDYDASGLACLDTLADFIAENNPEGLTGRAWKDKYYQEALGFEHSIWEDGPGVPGEGRFPCGWGIQASCRDLARAGQLWINDGLLPTRLRPEGVPIIPRDYMEAARRWAYPTSGTEYGYTTWLDVNDPVDQEVASFIGAGDQCVTVSHEHQVVIVSMGSASPGGCQSWSLARDFVVSRQHVEQWQNVTVPMRGAAKGDLGAALRDLLDVEQH
jgi:CubicO group peptidase (beta-lactamase class C family)